MFLTFTNSMTGTSIRINVADDGYITKRQVDSCRRTLRALPGTGGPLGEYGVQRPPEYDGRLVVRVVKQPSGKVKLKFEKVNGQPLSAEVEPEADDEASTAAPTDADEVQF